MTNEGNLGSEPAYESFLARTHEDVEAADLLTPAEYARRTIDQVTESLHEGIQSREEAISLHAKLDAIIEAHSTSPEQRLIARTLKSDIEERYPDTVRK